MKTDKHVMIDGNEAAARVAYQLNEVIALFPITPASPMGESADSWSAAGIKNLWGTVPAVIEMQSEGGAAGAIHGALQTGALSTTFTASQGLLLMIPNMFKIAGELTPFVLHVAARSIAAHALSIFGDHSDVMAARTTGFALLAAASVQEAQDFTLIAHAATFDSRIPFLLFFDGFRTSHEIAKIELLGPDTIRAMFKDDWVQQHRIRALSPDHPVVRGTAQNPDVFFQAREAANTFYLACPGIVQRTMDQLAQLTGRQYHIFDYHGSSEPDRVVVLMGSGCEAAHETVDFLNLHDQKVGVVKVRLFRPFDSRSFVAALPQSVKAVAILDRTKEPGSPGEPLYLDCVNALKEADRTEIRIVGGRYGLSSKEFTPAMIKGVFDNLKSETPKNHFTVGILDDVSGTSLEYEPWFSVEPKEVFRAVFYGLGSDGTVGANKESIKIIGENTNNYAQAYFVYDSKKAGAITISHLRFGPQPIRSTYLISSANFVGCHQPGFLERYSVLDPLLPNGVFLLNTPFAAEEPWTQLPEQVQRQLIAKRPRFFAIDANNVAREAGMGGRINTVMQTCFFAISGILPHEEAIAAIKDSIRSTYSKKGPEIVQMNLNVVDQALAHLHEITIPEHVSASPPAKHRAAPEPPPFVRDVLTKMIRGRGDELPVSALPVDGTFPTSTSRWEKRNLAQEVPVWDPEICIQCGKCVFVCPHAVIRSKVYEASFLKSAPSSFKSREARLPEWKGLRYTLQVSVEDCTGCGICVDVCPVRNKTETRLKAINMESHGGLVEQESLNWEFFSALPDRELRDLSFDNVRAMQVAEPLFEFSGACAGCGETPYIKLLTQLFGDRLLIANATGCSSIYGGNLPTTPYATGHNGHGPAWSNSLFEDAAEFGMGFRVSLDKQQEYAAELLRKLAGLIDEQLMHEILAASQKDAAGVYSQRERIEELKRVLARIDRDEARHLLPLADTFVRKSVWIIGGDGWGYDIGYGGLDHVLASGQNVKVLLLDTEVYSNTGGQCSKATPLGAVAKFAAAGKRAAKKDLGLITMSYGNVYVACVAMGAKDEHTLKAFLEAEAYHGPALIIAYSHCIAHGINMTTGMQNQKAAVQSGQWLLYRYNPALASKGQNPLNIDSAPPKIRVAEYLQLENRFRMLSKSKPEDAKRLAEQAQRNVNARWELYQHLVQNNEKGAP